MASDAPGVRRYAQHLLNSRTLKIVWNKGRVGHNYLGGKMATKEEKIETSVSAFTDVLIMSQADLLVSLSSKFPKAGEMIGMCLQRAIHLPGHPRHDLATNGGLLTQVWIKRTRDTNTPWTPEFTGKLMQQFLEGLPQGQESPCTKADNPLRSCYCMLKQGHRQCQRATVVSETPLVQK